MTEKDFALLPSNTWKFHPRYLINCKSKRLKHRSNSIQVNTTVLMRPRYLEGRSVSYKLFQLISQIAWSCNFSPQVRCLDSTSVRHSAARGRWQREGLRHSVLLLCVQSLDFSFSGCLEYGVALLSVGQCTGQKHKLNLKTWPHSR